MTSSWVMLGYRKTLNPVVVVAVALLGADFLGRSAVRGVRVRVRVNVNTPTGNQICGNHDLSINNRTTNGVFLCPLRGQPEHYTYCCGASGKQRCCGFYDDPSRAAGAICGYIGASVIGLLMVGYIVKILYSKFRHRFHWY